MDTLEKNAGTASSTERSDIITNITAKCAMAVGAAGMAFSCFASTSLQSMPQSMSIDLSSASNPDCFILASSHSRVSVPKNIFTLKKVVKTQKHESMVNASNQRFSDDHSRRTHSDDNKSNSAPKLNFVPKLNSDRKSTPGDKSRVSQSKSRRHVNVSARVSRDTTTSRRLSKQSTSEETRPSHTPPKKSRRSRRHSRRSVRKSRSRSQNQSSTEQIPNVTPSREDENAPRKSQRSRSVSRHSQYYQEGDQRRQSARETRRSVSLGARMLPSEDLGSEDVHEAVLRLRFDRPVRILSATIEDTPRRSASVPAIPNRHSQILNNEGPNAPPMPSMPAMPNGLMGPDEAYRFLVQGREKMDQLLKAQGRPGLPKPMVLANGQVALCYPS